MRKHIGCPAISLCVASAIMCGMAQGSHAAERANDAKPEIQPPTIISGKLHVTPSREGFTLDIDYNDVDVVVLLKVIAVATKLKIIISDDVDTRRVSVRMTNIAVEKLIQVIASTSGLAWGKVGTDTYLIVRQSAPPTRAVVVHPESVQPRSEPNFPPDWKRFEFNGTPFYVVPLNAGTATKPD